jgi:phosphoglycolate phosphatase
MKYKLAIFDFDGTLADSFPWFLSVLNDVADKYRFKRTADDEIEMLRMLNIREIIKHLQVPLWKMPLIALEMRKRMFQDIDCISTFPGVGVMLEELVTKNIVPAIVTSNSESNVRAVLGPLNANLIKYYACDTSLFGKSAKIKKLLQISGVSAAQAICIGDEVRDLNAARSLGIDFGAVAWGYANLQAFAAHTPDQTFLEMREIVDQITG